MEYILEFNDFINESKRDITDVKPGDIVSHEKTGERFKVNSVSDNKTMVNVIDRKGKARTLSTYYLMIVESSSD